MQTDILTVQYIGTALSRILALDEWIAMDGIPNTGRILAIGIHWEYVAQGAFPNESSQDGELSGQSEFVYSMHEPQAS